MHKSLTEVDNTLGHCSSTLNHSQLKAQQIYSTDFKLAQQKKGWYEHTFWSWAVLYFNLFNCCYNHLGISMLLTFVHLQTGWSSISCFRMFFSSASRPKYCQTTLFVFFFATKLSLVGLVAISCSHSRAHTLVPRPSSTAHARLSSSQYIDNVLETVVGL